MKSLSGVTYRNIIVRMPNWIGDMVMATPILSDLRKAYPSSRITVMCRAPACELLKEDPDIDELFCFSKSKTFSRRSDKKNLIAKLRQGKYDLGILLTNSFSSAWWFWQGRIKTRLGYNCNVRRFFLSKPVPYPEFPDKQHQVITYKNLLQPLGIAVSDTAPRLYLLSKEIEEARILLKQQGADEGMKIVGINPGAAYGSAKCWLPERFKEVVVKLLSDPQIRIVCFGDQQAMPLVKEICGGLGSHVINLAGLTSLREVAALISLCDVFLTGDSGPMHIADAMETEMVALFGSTNEIATGPYRKGKVIHKHVKCSPCYNRTCPIDFRCMKEISVEEVYESIIAKLKNTQSKLTILDQKNP